MRLKLLWVAPVLFAAGCAMTPEANTYMENARAAYREAAANPQVQSRAPVELQVAGRSLAEAERFLQDRAPTALVAHHAYLAEQRARIAIATADYRTAEAAVATSGVQQNQVLLEARTRELEAQKRETQLAREQAELARAQTELSRAQTLEEAKGLQSEIEELQSQMQELQARQTERGWVLTLSGDLLFDSGRAVLKPGGRKAVENLAQFMRKQPERSVTIEGFTDSTGSADLNQRLSEQRAQAVKEALVGHGIDAPRVQTRGYGPAFPVATNDTAVGRQLNRRVQVVIAPDSASAGGSSK